MQAIARNLDGYGGAGRRRLFLVNQHTEAGARGGIRYRAEVHRHGQRSLPRRTRAATRCRSATASSRCPKTRIRPTSCATRDRASSRMRGRQPEEGRSACGDRKMRHMRHGADLRGMMVGKVTVPTIAGRSARLHRPRALRFPAGARSGANAALMKPSVQKLTEDDAIAISAYVSSLEP